MDYTMRKVKEPLETYRLLPHEVNGVTFYILEIDSWCDVGVLVMSSKEDAEKLIARDNKYTHLTETDDWVCTELAKLIINTLNNPFENHIASRLCDKKIFFNMLDRIMWFRKDCNMTLIGLVIAYLVLTAFN